jgi:hypothetical protein
MSGVNLITSQMRTKYNDEFKYVYDRKQSLKPTVNNQGVQNGSSVVWDVVGASDAANVRTRDGLIPVSQLGLSAVTGTLEEHFKKFQIDNFDLFRANPNTRSAQATNGVGSCNKAVDASIIAQLDASSNAINGGSAIDFGVKSTFLTWVAALQNADVPWDGRVWGVITPNAWLQMETIDDFVSIDYNDVKPLVEGAPPPGQFRKWLGVNWIRHTGLTGFGGATAKCYIYHQDAVGHQIDNGGDPQTHMYYEDEEDRYGTWVKVVHCAKKILDAGIYRAVHNDTAAIA